MVVVADHGEQLGERGRQGHGRNLEEAVVRVPLIIRSPRGGPRRLESLFGLRRLPDLLLAGADPSSLTEDVLTTHLNPPEHSEVLVRAAQDADWKLVETVAGGASERRLYRLPDEDQDCLPQRPGVTAALAAHLAAARHSGTASMDEESAARLRALGYVE
jgi:arylsulfatase A-like enzyme